MARFASYLVTLSLLILAGCHKDNSPGKTTNNNVTVNNPIIPNNFLSGAKFDKLVVEIQYVTGHAPTAETITNLTTFLGQRLNKPNGISVSQNAIASPGKATLTLSDVQKIESDNRSLTTQGTTLTAYFFFADADYAGNAGNSKVLGIAYGPTSMVIFQKTILEYSGGLTQPSVASVESTVLEHEFGHILGLVNNGTGMVTSHQDVSNGHHCDNNNCLMYYSVETSDVIANLTGGSIPLLDANCLADLQANGGK